MCETNKEIYFSSDEKKVQILSVAEIQKQVWHQRKKINRIMQLLIFRSFSYEFYFIGTHQIYNSHTNNDGICFIIY